jgi:hypothetical protein
MRLTQYLPHRLGWNELLHTKPLEQCSVCHPVNALQIFGGWLEGQTASQKNRWKENKDPDA